MPMAFPLGMPPDSNLFHNEDAKESGS